VKQTIDSDVTKSCYSYLLFAHEAWQQFLFLVVIFFQEESKDDQQQHVQV
jgi:hypothetical protein